MSVQKKTHSGKKMEQDKINAFVLILPMSPVLSNKIFKMMDAMDNMKNNIKKTTVVLTALLLIYFFIFRICFFMDNLLDFGSH
jgi:hypothetical protein